MRRTTTIVVALIIATSPAAPSEGSQPTDATVDAYLSDEFERSSLPGMAVAVTEGDRIIHLAGYGTAGGGKAMGPDTPLRVASLSKSFTALAVLQLVEADEIDLDSPVRHYLPEFRVADAAASESITVRHLLHHTSGLADPAFPGLWDLDQCSLSQRVAQLSEAGTVAAPGIEHHYFNPNYEVLARIVEAVSGTDFDAHLEEEILAPLHMGDTQSLIRAEQPVDSLAGGHILAFGWARQIGEPKGLVAGSAGVVSTARDMARWSIYHLGGDGPLPRSTVELAHRPPDYTQSDYAMGWRRDQIGDVAVIRHNGILATSYAEHILMPETRHGIVIIANAYHAFNNLPRIADGVAAVLTGAQPAGGPTYRQLAFAIGVLALTGLGVRTLQIRRAGRWAERHRTGPGWSTYLRIGRLTLPLILLAALPTIGGWTFGRVFPHGLLALAMPEVVSWLVVASVSGLALAATRVRALRSAALAGRAVGPSQTSREVGEDEEARRQHGVDQLESE